MVFQILVKSLMGLEPGPDTRFLKHQFQGFIAGIMSLPVKIPGSRFYRSLQVKSDSSAQNSLQIILINYV